MNRWFQNVLDQLQQSDELLVDGMQRLLGSRASADLVWPLRTGAERWQALMHQVDVPVDVAAIFRSR